MAQLTAELERVLATRGITLDDEGNPIGKSVSSLPERVSQVPNINYNPVAKEYTLEWFYHQVGDYDQNGEVNINDLTPIGVHFGKDFLSPDWWEAMTADGDGNSEINIADITPIGLNYGIRVGGFAIDALQNPMTNWREYGYLSFEEGINNVPYKKFLYKAPGEYSEFGFRVSPVGPSREFTWNTYVIPIDDTGAVSPALAVDAGLPVLAFIGSEQGVLAFGSTGEARPGSPEDWYVHTVDFQDVNASQPRLVNIEGKNVICYNAEAGGGGFELRFAQEKNDNPASLLDWSIHSIAEGVTSESPGLTNYNSNPAVTYYKGGDLHLAQPTVTPPTDPADWGHCTIATGDNLRATDVTVHGDKLLIAAYQYGTPNTYFMRATSNVPCVPGDWTGYAVAATSGGAFTPSLSVVGGVPCIATMDETAHWMWYGMAQKQLPDSPGDWSSYPVFEQVLESTSPELAILDGKPMVAFGRSSMMLAWADSQAPSTETDWLVTEGIEQGLNFNTYVVSMVVIDHLPILAFVHYDNAADPPRRQIAIALATEK